MIGDKIKELRLQKKMTQAQLAGDAITRNQLSQIENNKSMPAVPTLLELAKRLDAPASYFFAETGDLDTFRKIGAIEKIKKLYAEGEYAKCLSRLRALGVTDDETELLFAKSSLACGIEKYRTGFLKSAEVYFSDAISHARNSIYADSTVIKTAENYIEAIRFVRTEETDERPAVEKPDDGILGVLADTAYIRALAEKNASSFAYAASCPLYAEHLEARADVDKGNFLPATEKLRGILSRCDEERYAVMKYYVLCDLEACSRHEGDYKSAYECSAARLALAEKMNK